MKASIAVLSPLSEANDKETLDNCSTEEEAAVKSFASPEEPALTAISIVQPAITQTSIFQNEASDPAADANLTGRETATEDTSNVRVDDSLSRQVHENILTSSTEVSLSLPPLQSLKSELKRCEKSITPNAVPAEAGGQKDEINSLLDDINPKETISVESLSFQNDPMALERLATIDQILGYTLCQNDRTTISKKKKTRKSQRCIRVY